jgi:hypothetical protein
MGVCSVRGRFRFSEPFVLFGLPGPSSVSGFGLGVSVDGSVGEPLGIIQVTDSMRVLFVGLTIPWSQVRVLAGPPPSNLCVGKLNIFHSVMKLRPGDCPLPGVPWSEAHLMEFMGLWRWDYGIEVPWCMSWVARSGW